MRSSWLLAASIAATLAFSAQLAKAQDFPTKPVRFVVPSSPGGGADVLGRSLGPKRADAWGRPYRWMPVLARDFTVVRPDLRGLV